MTDVEEMLNSEIDDPDETCELSSLENDGHDDEGVANSHETEVVSQPLDESVQEITVPGNENECAVCGKTFKRKSTLKRHISIHLDIIRCNRCGTTFSTEDKLLEHNQKYHQKVYLCDKCGLELKSKDSLQNHKILKHAAEGRAYECPHLECKKIFVKKTLFEDHMNSHVSMKQHKCGKCGKAFTFRYDMTKHAKTCEGTDTSKRLNSELDKLDETIKVSSLENDGHDDEGVANSHETEAVSQPLDESVQEITVPGNENECAVCGKTFTRKSTLKRHISIHLDIIRCNRCGTTFSTEDKLLGHNMKYHQNIYACDECGLVLKSKNSLQNHKILKHAAEGKTYECPYPECKKIFVKKTLFEDHMNYHGSMKQHKCGKCGKAFTFRYDMMKHAKTCGETNTSIRCDQCDRKFSNYSNLNTHRAAVHNQKQYPCSCGKTFKYITGLMKHRKNKKPQ